MFLLVQLSKSKVCSLVSFVWHSRHTRVTLDLCRLCSTRVALVLLVWHYCRSLSHSRRLCLALVLYFHQKGEILIILIFLIDHQQINTKFVRNHGIHLLDTSKSILGHSFVDWVNILFAKWFFINGSSLSVDHVIDLELKPNDLVQLWKTNLFWLLWAIVIVCKSGLLHCLK